MRVEFGNLNGRRWLLVCLCALALLVMPSVAHGQVTPESPEVKKLIDAGLGFLSNKTHDQLGGKCLIALAFLKAGHGDDPHIATATAECVSTVQANKSENELDVYSNGLAVILLCETEPQKYHKEVEWFLAKLKARQKPVGGWGYLGSSSGDTSQSQYGALSYWEANRRGFSLDSVSIDNFAGWLLKTQSPSGCWGYQGQVAPSEEQLIPQDEETCSMLAAGLGSLYICADLFGMRPKVTAKPTTNPDDELPAALRPVDQSAPGNGVKQYRPAKISEAKVQSTMHRAQGWMDKNYKIDIGEKRYYFLYGLERYKSFQELFEGTQNKSPKWYNDGYQFLAKDQKADGSWSGYCQAECDTSFAILFLIRSTQKSINAKLSEGSLVAGRGIPTNLKHAKLRNGQLVVEQVHTKVGELLSMIDDGDTSELEDLANAPSQIVVDQVDEKSARRLQQLVHGGEYNVRMLSVRALGRTGNLDYVPTLLYALTDPDRRVVLEARNELRFISRNFDGIGPPDNFTDEQRYEAIEAWKKWYLSIRPGAVLEKK